MKSMIESFWKLIDVYCEVLKERGEKIELKKEKEGGYQDAVKKRYNEYIERYMKTDKVKHLDRHKTAAILVVEGLKANIIKTETGTEKDKINIGEQKVLLICAFDYMLAEINSILREKNANLEPLKKIVLPKAWACETPYIDILSRSLYYAQKDFQLNDMELAEKFFLLEYSAILESQGSDAKLYFDALKTKKM